MSSVFLTARGDASAVLPAVTDLMNAASTRGRVFVEDPAALAAGAGRLEVQIADLDDAESRAVVLALIDQVKGGPEMFAIDDRAA